MDVIFNVMLRDHVKKSIRALLVTSVLGFVVALYTLWHHVSINNNALEAASFCNVSAYVNCDAVALSPYSAVLGYPVAGLLVIFYGVLFCLGAALSFATAPSGKRNATQESDARALRSSLFVLTTLAMLPTLLLAAISAFVLKLLCLLCLTSYVINAVLWVITWRLRSNDDGLSPLPPNSTRVPTALVALVLALSPLMIKGMVSGSGIDDNVLRSVLSQHFSATPSTIATEGFPSIGPSDAKIVVVEYSDFQCPYCARASTVVPQVVRASPGTRFVFKNFPLDPSCNPTMQGRGHPLACVAAKTGHCLFKSKGNDAFFAYEKSVFAQQPSLSAPLIEKIALENGISLEELKVCIDSPETHASIVAQAEEAKAVGVTGTPAIYVNGRKLEYGPVAKVLKAVLARYSETSSNAGQ